MERTERPDNIAQIKLVVNMAGSLKSAGQLIFAIKLMLTVIYFVLPNRAGREKPEFRRPPLDRVPVMC